MRRQIEDVISQERLTAREYQHHLRIYEGDLIDDPKGLVDI
jgi:hypothetical protein